MVDVVLTGVSGRAQMATALCRFAGLDNQGQRSDQATFNAAAE
jgi:hypothetical protein